MRSAFLMPAAWSLYVLSPFHPPQRHVLTPHVPYARDFVQETLHGHKENWQVVSTTTTREIDEDDVISLPSLSLLPMALQDPLPVHPRSLHHFQAFSTSVYAQHMTYPQFCAWESFLARVVFSYLGDTRRHWIVEVDPFFLYSDSIREYGTLEAVQQTFWITPSAEVGVPDAVLFSKAFDASNEHSSN